MAIPSGLDAQIGFAAESVWGTPVTVTEFVPLVSESLVQDIARIESQGIRPGRRTRHTWKPGAITNSGTFNLELPNVPMATLLEQMFGTYAEAGGDGTASPGPLTGKSMTVQVGIPDIGGTVRAKTYNGSKVASWEIGCTPGEFATLAVNLSMREEKTDVALASASYAAGYEPFTFVEAGLSIASSEVAVARSMTLTGDNALAVDRHRIKGALIREQLESGQRQYGGSIAADFEDLTAYNRFVSGTEAALVMSFENSSGDELAITCNVRFDGTTPQVSGMDLLEQQLPFVCTSDDTDAAAITAVLTNSETAV